MCSVHCEYIEKLMGVMDVDVFGLLGWGGRWAVRPADGAPKVEALKARRCEGGACVCSGGRVWVGGCVYETEGWQVVKGRGGGRRQAA